MKIFIWENLDRVSDSYHGGGGLAVIAKDLNRAKEIATYDGKWLGKDQYEQEKIEIESAPDFESDVSATEEKVFIFPDAGCC